MPELGSEVTLAALTVYVVLVVLPLLSVVVELSTVTFVPPFTTVELPLVQSYKYYHCSLIEL